MHLARAVQARLREKRSEILGEMPPGIIEQALAEFRSDGFCRFPKQCRAAGDVLACDQRCGQVYWRAHGDTVGRLMEQVAKRLGLESTSYLAAGVLHDADYLCHPHDRRPLPAKTERHPMPLVRFLDAHGAPADVSLAILEHAPWTSLEASGLMSHALRVCDVMVTGWELRGRAHLWDTRLEFLHEVLAARTRPPMADDRTMTPGREGDDGFAATSAQVLAVHIHP